MLKKLKKDVEKVNKTICDHNGNINKEIENQKRNCTEILDLESG